MGRIVGMLLFRRVTLGRRWAKASPGLWMFLLRFQSHAASAASVGSGEKGYQNGGEVVPFQGSRSE